jgi:hypothetical protein
MTAGTILEPLIVKAMATKGYDRKEAAKRAFNWLAKELQTTVERLPLMDDEQIWCAHALVEKAMIPPPKKTKRKVVMPEAPLRSGAEEPLGDVFWDGLKTEWGELFFNAFFGDFTPVKVEGTLSPGQYAIDEIKKVNTTALFDAA